MVRKEGEGGGGRGRRQREVGEGGGGEGGGREGGGKEEGGGGEGGGKEKGGGRGRRGKGRREREEEGGRLKGPGYGALSLVPPALSSHECGSWFDDPPTASVRLLIVL